MANAKTTIPERVLPERTVNVEEFSTIGIVQMFERLGWERVLDWCEDITSRVYLASVCEWLASLRFEKKDGLPHTWKLVGDTGRGQMVMSFETMNCIARFDSLRDDEYTYYTIDQFLDNKMNAADPDGIWFKQPCHTVTVGRP
ncbi:hypothetical protein HanRHA438_Chr09g0407801 [Helianthus annuus]|uniref:Uncharacterized protein n=1 Tax=Helianthus annuus TaxID=4232 RepID=A0A9K3N8V3_HELAN|nr:hypothetical protein HanXRQr2_Chr09g0395951 [Helianthus annuus]KAJ0526595.1 hypothetical protein HanHA300_Chr09g0324931 [Helianthus annuus]KAJ0535093.1 hypothetical protein HanIR_Chr09g0426931 [Helianthus annuus]KAJ0542988.1 hypothetical protein HanHA89_Chr09g0345841 [Helianthus annuus]KAJ0708042.1 hypothetical protein HanLR1_Chr09g0325161 [Helianthus annuus]